MGHLGTYVRGLWETGDCAWEEYQGNQELHDIVV